MTHMNSSTASTKPSISNWLALAIMFLSLAMSLIDLTVANIALPSIREGLNPSTSSQSWIIAGYALAYALSLVPGGRFGDKYGHKYIFLLGTASYTLTGIAVVLSTNELSLVIFRLLHGISGGLMIPAVAAMIQILFQDKASRARAYGLYAFTVSVAALFGPIIGGWIIEMVGMENGWRWALAYGLSLGIIAILLGFPFLPNPKKSEKNIERFDWVGSVLMSLVVIGLFVPLIQMTSGTIAWWAPISAGAGLIVFAIFIFWEKSQEQRNMQPLLSLTLFKERSFSFGLASAFLTFASFTGSIYIAFAVLWQSGRNEGALAASLVILPFSLGSTIAPLISDYFANWLKKWVIPISLFLLCGGYLITYSMLSADPHLSAMSLAVPLFIAGFGSGLFFGLNMVSTLSTVPSRTAGSAGGMLVTTQRIGAAFGSAIVILLISQPGPNGPNDFSPEVMLATGTASILVCAILSGSALIVSLIEVLVMRKESSFSNIGLKPHKE